MCKEAREIQELRKLLFEEGDWFLSQEEVDLSNDKFDCKLSASCRCVDLPLNNTVRIWIPGQDSIQKILTENNKFSDLSLLAMFADTILNQKEFCQLKNYWKTFTTFEEIWLAFFYFDIGKIWEHKTLEWKVKSPFQ